MLLALLLPLLPPMPLLPLLPPLPLLLPPLATLPLPTLQLPTLPLPLLPLLPSLPFTTATTSFSSSSSTTNTSSTNSSSSSSFSSSSPVPSASSSIPSYHPFFNIEVCVVDIDDSRLLLEAVGDVLVSKLLSQPKSSEKLIFGLLLASPLEALRKRGLAVDRFEKEMAFAQQQQHEAAANVLQVIARGALVRWRFKRGRQQRLDRERAVAVSSIELAVRRWIAIRELQSRRAARATSAAVLVQSHARRRAAVTAALRAADEGREDAARDRAARVLQAASANLLRCVQLRTEEVGRAELERRREQWKLAKELEKVEAEEAAREEHSGQGSIAATRSRALDHDPHSCNSHSHSCDSHLNSFPVGTDPCALACVCSKANVEAPAAADAKGYC